MKTYLVIETQNTGGVPPTGSTFDEDFGKWLRDKLLDERFTQRPPRQDGDWYSENEVVRVRVLEVEV